MAALFVCLGSSLAGRGVKVQISALTKVDCEWDNTLGLNKAAFLSCLLDNLGDAVVLVS